MADEKKANPFAKAKGKDNENVAKEKDTGNKIPPFSKMKSDEKSTDKKANPFAKGKEEAGGDKKVPPFAKGKDGKKPVPGAAADKAALPEKGEQDKVRFNPQVPNLEEEFAYICEGDFDLLDEEIRQEYITEVLSLKGRLERRATMRKFRSKIRQRRARAVQRRATGDVIQSRARRKAIGTLKTRFSQGRNTNDLAVSEKARIERMVAARKKLVGRLASKMVKDVRATERQRLQGKHK